MHGGVPQALFIGQAVVLVATTVLIVYPVVAYARNVAYTEAFVFLALSLVSLTVVGILDFLFAAHTPANVVRLLGGAFAFAGVWFFARDFIHVGGSSDRFGDFGDHVDSFGGDDGD